MRILMLGLDSAGKTSKEFKSRYNFFLQQQDALGMFLLELHRNSIPFFFEPIRTRETQTRNVFRLCFILMLVLITISFEWIIKYHINARVRLIIKHLQTYIQNTKSELNLVDDKTTFAYRTLQKKEIYRIEYDLFSMCFDDLIVFVVIWMILSPFYIFTFREFQRNRLFMFWTGFYNLGFSSWISFKQTFSLVFMTLNRSGKKSTWRCSVLNRFNFCSVFGLKMLYLTYGLKSILKTINLDIHGHESV